MKIWTLSKHLWTTTTFWLLFKGLTVSELHSFITNPRVNVPFTWRWPSEELKRVVRYKQTTKRNLNVSYIGWCDCKALITFYLFSFSLRHSRSRLASNWWRWVRSFTSKKVGTSSTSSSSRSRSSSSGWPTFPASRFSGLSVWWEFMLSHALL